MYSLGQHKATLQSPCTDAGNARFRTAALSRAGHNLTFTSRFVNGQFQPFKNKISGSRKFLRVKLRFLVNDLHFINGVNEIRFKNPLRFRFKR